MKRLCLAVACVVLLAPSCLGQTDRYEEELNDEYPAKFLSGNPLFQSGDRLLGSIALHGEEYWTPTDFDVHNLTFAGTGSPGIYRYVFDLDTGGEDSILVLRSHVPALSPWYLGFNDDLDPGIVPSSRIVFDHFDKNGADTVWGVDISTYDTLGEMDYALTITREPTPVTSLGAIARGVLQADGLTPGDGSGVWYRFTLEQDAPVTIDTLGSQVDTQIALFDAMGNTLGASDDVDFWQGDLSSRIRRMLTAGDYFIALTGRDPYGYNLGAFYNWNDALDRPLGWDRDGFAGDTGIGCYRLRVTVGVPEPGPLALLAGSGAGAAWLLRRARRRGGR